MQIGKATKIRMKKISSNFQYISISNNFFFLYKHKVYKYTEAEIHFKNNQKNIQKNP